MLIEINNSVGPWLSEICAAFYFVAAISLWRTWYKSRTPDALIVFGYLTILMTAVYLPNTWLNLRDLMAIHLISYTGLIWLHAAHNHLRTVYGDYLLVMAGLMGLVDGIFLGWGFPIQYQVWLIDAIFITITLSALYVSLNSRHNGGNMGRQTRAVINQNKIIAQPAKT